MADREVTLKLNAKMDSGGDAALKGLGDAARDASQQELALNKALKDTGYQLQKLDTSTLKNAKDAAKAFTEELKKGAVANWGTVGKPPPGENKGGRGGGRAPGTQEDSSALGFSALLSKAAIPLAAFTAGLTIAGKGLTLFKDSFEHGRFSFLKFEDNIVKSLSNIPLVGEIAENSSRNDWATNPMIRGIASGFGWGEAAYHRLRGHDSSISAAHSRIMGEYDERYSGEAGSQSLALRRQQRALLLQAQQEAAMRTPLVGQRDRQMREFERQQLDAGMRLQMGTGYGESEYLKRDIMAETARKQATTGASNGYSGAEQRAELQQQAEHQNEIAQLDQDASRKATVLDAQRSLALKQQSDIQQKLIEQENQLKKARETLGQHQQGGGATQETIDNDRLRVETESLKYAELLKQAEEAKVGTLKIENELLDQGNNYYKQRLDILGKERDRQAAKERSEKERYKSEQSAFGLKSPMEKRAEVMIARKLKAGQQLNPMEIQRAAGSQLLAPMLQEYGRQHAGPEWDELVKLTGFDQRAKQAEQMKLQLENQIKVQIELGEEGIAKQLTEAIIPQIHSIMEQVKQSFAAELARLQNRTQANQRAASG